MNLNQPRRCPVDPECVTAPSILLLTEHVYAEHTEGPEAERWEVTERLMYRAAAQTEAASPGIRPEPVRRDCAFCGRERSAKDDNHGPGCAYWSVFGTEGS